MKYMPKHIRIGKTQLISFCCWPRRARQIFIFARKNHLNVAIAMPYAIFTSIYQKFDTRRMEI